MQGLKMMMVAVMLISQPVPAAKSVSFTSKANAIITGAVNRANNFLNETAEWIKKLY